MPDLNDTTESETRLRRFLYLGREKPEYQPGNWFVHNYYDDKNLSSIEELAVNPEKIGSIIYFIEDAFKKNLVQNTETLTFALAMCAHQSINQELKKKSYQAVKEICKTPESFILFNKFCSQLSKKKEKSGWGHGWKNTVKNWYDSKSTEELARLFSHCKGRYGWKHKDIIKMAHYKSADENKQFVMDYVMRGLKKLKEKSETNPLNDEKQKILQILESAEDFKHCEDPVRAGGLIESMNLTFNHVPGHLLTSKEIWESLVSTMGITELLKNLQRIHNLKFLTDNNLMTNKVLDILTEKNLALTQPNIHPAVFLVALKDYENSGKPLSFEKRKAKEAAKRPVQQPPAPNKKITDALTKMLNLSFTQLQEEKTNVHYMITINTDKIMKESSCWHCGNVSPIEAACLIALSLLRAEKDVTVALFTKDGIQCIELSPNLTYLQTLNQLKKYDTNTNEIDLSKPMTWAAEQNKSIDVFVNFTDQIHRKSDNSESGIKAYRTKMNQPNAKLVNCSMCSSYSYNKTCYDNHILTIYGFDEKVPKIIEAFARSLF